LLKNIPMRRTTSTISTIAALSIISAAANAQSVSFQMIPGAASANDLSPNGRFIVGMSLLGRAYIYDTTTSQMTLLPVECQEATAVSDDGTVVVGDINDPITGDEVAALWTASSNVWTSLGYLPDALSCPSRSNAYELSADGSVVVGLSWDGCSGRGFRWTQATGMVELEPLANGGNRASVVSANGSIIAGFAQGSFSRTPSFWTANGDGFLIDPPNGDLLGEVHGMNDAGTLLMGEAEGKAVLWSNNGTTETVIGAGALLPGWRGIPMDIANNGAIVGFDILLFLRRAWIRPGSTGPMVDLRDYIEGNGGSVPEDMELQVCQAISADGSVVIGHTGFVGAWMVTIDTVDVCIGDFAPPGGDGMVDASDLAVVLGAWGGAAGDLTGDGTTDASDLAVILGEWGSCAPTTGACCLGDSCSILTEAECASVKGAYLGNNVPCTASACVNNDACADAIDITAWINQGPIDGDTLTATPGIFQGLDPELPAGSPSCHWDSNPAVVHSTVWYKFVAPEAYIQIDTCASNPALFVDSIITVYSGECGNLVEVACDEDNCSLEYPYYSSLFVDSLLTPGQTYYICVANSGGWSGSTPGEFKLTLTLP
jgi:uncharacterized membrane protein